MDGRKKPVRWLLVFVAVAALAVTTLSSCGAGDRPVKRDSNYFETLVIPIPETYSSCYFPYVENVELIGTFRPDEVMTAVIAISFPGEIPENLYYKDTMSNPISDWWKGSAQLDVRLLELCDEAAAERWDIRLYDGSGQLEHQLVAPTPGYYLLWYRAARSPEEAGEYLDNGYNPALTILHRPLRVHEAY